MKKMQTIGVCLGTLLLFVILINSCSKDDRKGESASLSNLPSQKNEAASLTAQRSGSSCGSCNRFYSNTHAGIGLYVYPDIQLDLSCAVSSSTVTLGCTYYDVPNRYTIYDKNGAVVVTTGWIGWAHCSGPWGASVTTPNVETFINFTYNTGLAPYKLRVETKVTGCTGPGCSTDPGCRDNDDNWQVRVMCITSTCPTPPCPGEPTSCNDCNKYFQATHAGTGLYFYPDYSLNLCCAVDGSTVTVGCTYYDVPNRFTIYDKNGAVKATTGWIGWAHCTGPWGASVTTPNVETFINFTYNTSLAPYKLRVETKVTGCTGAGCSTDPGCTDNDDNWVAHIMCIPKSEGCP